MGAADCKGFCHETSPITVEHLSTKEFTLEEIQHFVNNVEPFFDDGNMKDVANLRDLQDYGIQNLKIRPRLQQLFEEFNIKLQESPKLWKLNRHLEQLSSEYGPAYIWNKTLDPQQIQKQLSMEIQEKQKLHRQEKQLLLSSKIHILIASKDSPKQIIAYFTGSVHKGYAQGQNAIFVTEQGVIYRGYMVNSSANGLGTFQNRVIGYTYEGSWFQDYPHSINQQATEKIAVKNKVGNVDHDIYLGQFKLGRRQGVGSLSSPAKYESPRFQYSGEFKNGVFHGEGTLTIYPDQSQDQEVYAGDFKMGKKDGFGEYKGKQFSYKGQWKDDKKCGKGQYIYKKSGITYKGNFKDDTFSGEGSIFNQEGLMASGLWVNGKCILKITGVSS